MNKNELAETAAARTDVSVRQAKQVMDALFAVIAEQNALGNKVTIQNFGTFEGVEREARIMRNPSTGEEILVDATRLPRFKALKGFKDVVAGRVTIKTGA